MVDEPQPPPQQPAGANNNDAVFSSLLPSLDSDSAFAKHLAERISDLRSKGIVKNAAASADWWIGFAVAARLRMPLLEEEEKEGTA